MDFPLSGHLRPAGNLRGFEGLFLRALVAVTDPAWQALTTESTRNGRFDETMHALIIRSLIYCRRGRTPPVDGIPIDRARP